jgi:hypothetical protein
MYYILAHSIHKFCTCPPPSQSKPSNATEHYTILESIKRQTLKHQYKSIHLKTLTLNYFDHLISYFLWFVLKSQYSTELNI